jgi:hypothetical protein
MAHMPPEPIAQAPGNASAIRVREDEGRKPFIVSRDSVTAILEKEIP